MELAPEMKPGGVCQVVKWGGAHSKRKQYKESLGGRNQDWTGVQEMGRVPF